MASPKFFAVFDVVRWNVMKEHLPKIYSDRNGIANLLWDRKVFAISIDVDTGYFAPCNDVRSYVMTSHRLHIIPQHTGGGTRIKAYEAMAMAKAVVSRRIGVEGLACKPL